MAQLALITVLLLHSLLSTVYAGTWIRRGPCPKGRNLGDVWQLEKMCGEEKCTDSGVVGVSCGLFSIHFDNKKCKLEYNKEADYPACCAPIVNCDHEEDEEDEEDVDEDD